MRSSHLQLFLSCFSIFLSLYIFMQSSIYFFYVRAHFLVTDDARLRVGVLTCLRKMLLQCQLHQGTLMKRRFNLLWKEVFLQSLVFLEQ